MLDARLNPPAASVVVVTLRRLSTLAAILEAWLKETPDVWLADCSGADFKAPRGVHHVRFSPDPGNKARHAVALMTEGEIVFKADDDFIPFPGLIEDFLKAFRAQGRAFYGIMGRYFNGPRYYGNTIQARANKITEPFRVDFVGICTMAPRDLIVFDPRECGSPFEELFYQCGIWPEVPKWVVPTVKYAHVPGSDRAGTCLCKDTAAQAVREAFYSKVWDRSRAERLKND